MIKLMFFLSILFPIISYYKIINTIAGTGIPGDSGDGGSATAAKITDPNGGFFDSYGNYYFVQNNGNSIRKIDTNGNITTIAGTGVAGYNGDEIPATSAELKFPNTVIVDTSNNIYVCDVDNCRIRKINISTGLISTIAGNGTPGFSGDNGPATSATLNFPAGICFDRKGNLYIGDGSHRVRKVNTSGIITTYAGIGIAGISGDGGPATAAKSGTGALLTDAIGNLYIADNAMGESRIGKIDTFGIITTFAGTDTGYIYNGDDIAATTANINPIYLSFDQSDNLYFADLYNNRIRKINTTGIISNVAGNGTQGFLGDGGPATAAEFNWPEGIAIDVCNNLYIADVNNARIRKVLQPPILTVPIITLSGAISTALGSSVTISATIANAGSSYIIEWMNHGIEFTTTTVPSVTYTKGAGIDTITAKVVPTGYGCWDSTTSAGHVVSVNTEGNVQIGKYANVQIWPNPVKDVLYIYDEATIIINVTISNLLGQAVVSKECNAKQVQMDVGGLPGGVYFVKVNGIYVQELIKE